MCCKSLSPPFALGHLGTLCKPPLTATVVSQFSINQIHRPMPFYLRPLLAEVLPLPIPRFHLAEAPVLPIMNAGIPFPSCGRAIGRVMPSSTDRMVYFSLPLIQSHTAVEVGTRPHCPGNALPLPSFRGAGGWPGGRRPTNSPNPPPLVQCLAPR